MRHKAIEKMVTRESSGLQEKKYYRYRVDRWYGGIVTGDVVGCGLFCRFCWVKDSVLINPQKIGKFYSSIDATDRLLKLLNKSEKGQLRLSGGEPTIGRKHLLELLDNFRGRGYRFVLETNGVLLGHDRSYAEDLSKYDFLHVRVSLKGCNENEFSALTGSESKGFDLQIESLKNLNNAKVSCHPSVMVSFSTESSFKEILTRLSEISLGLEKKLEIEELIQYPRVRNRLNKYGLWNKSKH
ncbi:MAG: radical SAM protein [Candidatus Bathyarchaeota archaeon]|nr:radical SAM protein [Candidatus Bathyarchaeota archaeon]